MKYVALFSLSATFKVLTGPTCGSSIVACSLLFWKFMWHVAHPSFFVSIG